MIILLGLAGSGKSTQGQRLADKRGWKWLSAGQVLREAGTEPEKVNNGVLVDSEVVEGLLLPEIARYETEGVKVVLDGYPRDEEQAQRLINNKEMLQVTEKVVYLEVPLEELKERMMLRGRTDDTEEVIARRLKGSEQIICAILDKLEGAGVTVLRVDGTGTMDEVEERVATEVGD